MVKLKYGVGQTPLRNKRQGWTFIPSHYGQSALIGQPQKRTRKKLQWLRMQCNQKAVMNWRNLTAAQQTAWETFAATYPQPTQADANKYLSGYQLFVKRNFYRFLHEGINADFITNPVLESLPDPNFSAEITDNGMCLDVTEWYLKNFGILPQVGDTLICRILPMAIESGQFFSPLVATLEVEQVYIDGLFLSLNFSNASDNIVFSVYLSKPVRPGVAYPGTKFRYMGCFKPTTFIQLTDTPADYTGQAGKVPAVKATEDGLEFVEVGGGGLDCDDLEDCSVIESIQDQINNIGSIVSLAENTSIPPIKYGLLYNWLICASTPTFVKPGWHVITNAEISSLISFFGSVADATYAMCEANSLYWSPLDPLFTNSAKTNVRGSGFILNSGSSLNERSYYWGWCQDEKSPTNGAAYKFSKNSIFSGYNLSIPKTYGMSIRLVKDSTTLAEGESGTYVGFNNRIYRTIVVNGMEILADNLAETFYSDKSPILQVASSSEWASLNSAACAAYQYNSSLV